MDRLPLLRHSGQHSVVAYCGDGPITLGRFLHDVREVARALPDVPHVLNVCADRYRFAVGLAAALTRGQATLLPPNQTPEMLERLQSGYAGLYRLADGPARDFNLPTVAFPAIPAHDGHAGEVPSIPASQPATLMFTSGSTGDPVPHMKTWGTLVASGAAEGARLGLADSGAVVLGTVPPQHMYGLESTVIMPLQCGLALHHARPFYPADVCDALAALPRPRALVTTPVHLRALICGVDPLPVVDLVICATAPLATDLAHEAEARFGAPLHEIYGCTEAGQIASRRTTESAQWQLLPGMRLFHDEQGPWVHGGHVDEATLLSDMIELCGPERFVLHGRNADLVNIAGKRTSLAHLNHQLNSIDGVEDGVFVLPGEDSREVARLMAFVVAPGKTRSAILDALRSRIDPAFMPRPLVLVDALPRNATGKLPHAALQALAAESAAGDT